MDATLVAGGFGKRGVEGKIRAVQYARENKVPYLGICLGMQVAVIEFARHCAGLDAAHSTEFAHDTPNPVIGLITEWQAEDGTIERRSQDSDLGGTMRLGGQPVSYTHLDVYKRQSTFFGSVWWLLVALGVLVTFHEFGHFWVARRCGVKVLRFSVGFGAPLWTHVGKDGTEYVLAAIPLGGDVRMLAEREGDVPPQERHLAFNNKSVWQRIAIVAAGPFANLLLAFLLLWGMLVIGRPDYAPVVGQANALAAQAGLHLSLIHI